MLFGDNFLITRFFELKLYIIHVNVFLSTQKQNFSWIGQKTKNFPKDPHCRNRQIGTPCL